MILDDDEFDEDADTVIVGEPRVWDPADVTIEFDENWWDEL